METPDMMTVILEAINKSNNAMQDLQDKVDSLKNENNSNHQAVNDKFETIQAEIKRPERSYWLGSMTDQGCLQERHQEPQVQGN